MPRARARVWAAHLAAWCGTAHSPVSLYAGVCALVGGRAQSGSHPPTQNAPDWLLALCPSPLCGGVARGHTLDKIAQSLLKLLRAGRVDLVSIVAVEQR